MTDNCEDWNECYTLSKQIKGGEPVSQIFSWRIREDNSIGSSSPEGVLCRKMGWASSVSSRKQNKDLKCSPNPPPCYLMEEGLWRPDGGGITRTIISRFIPFSFLHSILAWHKSPAAYNRSNQSSSSRQEMGGYV